MDIPVLGAARKYARDTMAGAGAIKGDPGRDGTDGYSPTITENPDNSDTSYKLDVTDANGTFTTPNLKGTRGNQGIQGPQGLKGDTGETGPQGSAGTDGYSPTVNENVDNSDSTYKLDITDVNGTFSTPNLIGRQGPQGLRGLKGDAGETGPAGETGQNGFSPLITTNTANSEDIYKLDITDVNGTYSTPNLIGRQGVQGIQGERGEQGPQGIQGIQGPQGEKGNDGYPFLIYREYTSLDEFDVAHFPEIGLMFMIKPEEGLTNYPIYRYTGVGDTPYSYVTELASSEGLKGDKGDKGDQGEQGPEGPAGLDGITYTPVIGTVTTVASTSDATAELVVNAEAKTATFNFALPKGAAGAIGGKGDKGDKGDTGETGPAGLDGITYTPVIGTISMVDSMNEATASVDIDEENERATFNFSIPRGQNGIQGIQGEPGEQGPPGTNGIDGLDGTTYMPAVGTVSTVEFETGADVSIDIDEDAKQATFNFSIPKGETGAAAVQYTPIITENKELAWENDGGLENPPTTPIQQIYTNTPIGTVISFAGSTAPNGYLICNGQSVAVADYPDLYAVIGNTYGGDSTNFNVPDYRETVLVGVGENTTDTIASHDVYGLGEFKDDQVQNHTHNINTGVNTNGSYIRQSGTYAGAEYRTYSSTINSGRTGTTTHGKQKGVVYIIKAFHTNEGQDEGISDDVVNYVDNKVNSFINDTTSGTQSTWSSSKIASEINPVIDDSKVFSNGTLNISTLCSTYGNGRYVIVGQGTAGNGSATIDIWTLSSNAISYIVNVTYSNKTSNIFVGYTYDSSTISLDTSHFSHCNHIAKVCALA